MVIKLIILRENIISLKNFQVDETKKEEIFGYIENDKLVSRIDKEIIHQVFHLTLKEFNSIIIDLKDDEKRDLV